MEIGSLGEKQVMLSLSKIGIDSIKLPSTFPCDIFCSNGLRIEVKTSTLRKEGEREYWSFKLQNSQVRNILDYFILVCLDKNLEVENLYVVPNNIILKRDILSIPRNPKGYSYNGFSLNKYKNNFKNIFQKTNFFTKKEE